MSSARAEIRGLRSSPAFGVKDVAEVCGLRSSAVRSMLCRLQTRGGCSAAVAAAAASGRDSSRVAALSHRACPPSMVRAQSRSSAGRAAANGTSAWAERDLGCADAARRVVAAACRTRDGRRKASQSAATAGILGLLACDDDTMVRRGVASNPATPTTVLQHLTNDVHKDVRRTVAANTAAPAWLMEQIAEDPHTSVRRDLAANSSTPVRLLEQLADDRHSEVRRMLTENPNCPPRLLEQLAEDRDDAVRAAVARHDACPASLLMYLAEDSSSHVRIVARANLQTATSAI